MATSIVDSTLVAGLKHLDATDVMGISSSWRVTDVVGTSSIWRATDSMGIVGAAPTSSTLASSGMSPI
jgi:hypothetical protein